MPIILNLDVMLAKRKMSLTRLSEKTGVHIRNLSIMKTNVGRAVRYSTLDAICRELECQPSDLIEYVTEEEFNNRKRFNE